MRRAGAACAVGVLSVLVLAPGPAGAQAPAKASLVVGDCAKCHEGPPADVEAAGGKHKSEVTCLDCHEKHRPASKDNIPKCGACHEGKAHYDLKNCLECHRNPHKPLALVIGAKVTEPCLTCHAEQIQQLKASPSKHSAFFCTNCHDVHRTIPECVKCHKPHSDQMTQADCGKCHKAHRPKNVAYAEDLPSAACGACHGEALTLLAATQTKHRDVPCAKCHKQTHRAVPACGDCHGQPHPEGIIKKFPKCGDCHSTAHDLNHWTDQAKPQIPKVKKR